VVIEPELRGDASVGIWSARRNADLLASAIDRRVEISS
jgi:hypothetical protein